MFSYLEKVDTNLYTETETLKKIFQSGKDLPYLNQVRIIFEGMLDYIALKLNFQLKEKTLGAKLNNEKIAKILFDDLKFNKDEVEEVRLLLNDASHFNVNKQLILKKYNKEKLVEFLYNSLKVVMEKFNLNIKLKHFNHFLFINYIENSDVVKQIEKKEEQLIELETSIQKKIENSKNIEKKITELEYYYLKRKNEILSLESSKSNNELYELANRLLLEENYASSIKVFSSLKMSNIMDIRAYIGVLLCEYKSKNIDEMIELAIQKEDNISELEIFEETQTFLKPEDKNFIYEIYLKIENGIKINQIYNLIDKKEYTLVREKIYDLSYGLKEYEIKNIERTLEKSILYDQAILHFNNREYNQAISIFSRISNFKNSNTLLEEAKIKQEEIDNISLAKYNDDGLLISRDGKILLEYDGYHNVNQTIDIIIPNTVEKIKKFGFNDRDLRSVFIPNTVKEIAPYLNFPYVIFCEGYNHYGEFNRELYVKYYKVYFGSTRNVMFYEDGNVYFLDLKNNKLILALASDKNESFVISEGVDIIGRYAFYNCKKIRSIKSNNSITEIEKYAFENCVNLQELEISSKVTKIDEHIVNGCKSLVKVSAPSLNYSNTGWAGSTIDIKNFNEMKYVGNEIRGIFLESKNIVLSNSIKKIYNDVFIHYNKTETVFFEGEINDWLKITFCNYYSNPMCYSKQFYIMNDKFCKTSLTNLVVPDVITKIGDYQCVNLKDLSEISFHKNVEYIGRKAFYGCDNLEIVDIPESVKKIGCSAFKYNEKIKTYCANDGLYLGNEHINDKYLLKIINNDLTKIEISDNTLSIGPNAFSNCKCLEEIIISKSVISFGEDAFYKCNIIEKLYYKGTIEDWCNVEFENGYSNPMSIAKKVFMLNQKNEWYEVNDIIIPTSINKIGDHQFYRFNNLHTVQLHKEIIDIGDSAFSSCSSLKEIVIPVGVETIGKFSFGKCMNLVDITIPHTIKKIEMGAFNDCKQLFNLYYYGTIDDWCKIDFIISDSNRISNPMVYAKQVFIIKNEKYVKLIDLEIPEGVNKIKKYQFMGLSSIKKIKIPNSVIEIEYNAFQNCKNLESIILGSRVEIIGGYAFLYCESLLNVFYNGTLETWCNIKFNNEYSTPMRYASHFSILNSGEKYCELVNLNIPDTIREINPYQFEGFSNITSVFIPKSINKVDWRSFRGCNNIKTITKPKNLSVNLPVPLNKISLNIIE